MYRERKRGKKVAIMVGGDHSLSSLDLFYQFWYSGNITTLTYNFDDVSRVDGILLFEFVDDCFFCTL